MKVTFWILSIVTALLMLWHPAEIFFGNEAYNLFVTKANTYAQPVKWYVFFTQGFIERTILIAILYWHLSKTWINLHFLKVFLVYNAWRIFEYWFFAFSIDRYLVILTVLIISSWLYGKHKPRKRLN